MEINDIIMKKGKDKIPEEFKSIEEIQNFWDTHSTSDYLDEMEDIKMDLSFPLKSKLELKKLYNFPRLLNATPEQRQKYEISGGGTGLG